jgi:hypothetical protein
MSEFQTYKTDLTRSRIVVSDERLARDQLQSGDILLHIERFAFTANNVTYGAAGDTIGYWKFFPAADDVDREWGCLPVWGTAEIIDSKVEGLNIGERVYGYLPPADFVVLSPVALSAQRFVDGAAHRAELPAVYNHYQRLSAEADYDRATDNIRALLQPLHMTAFCLCDALQDSDYHGAEQVIILSASSKTAIGTAQGLAEQPHSPPLVGVTSRANRDFVAALGCYHEVHCYDDLPQVTDHKPSVMIDMAGNREVLGTLHGALGDNLRSCISVGMTHWESLAENSAMAAQINRQRSHFFFAPAHVQKRVSDWGADDFAACSGKFVAARMQQSSAWMRIEKIAGLSALGDIYADLVVGKMDPRSGLVVVL